jgi:protein TonB
VVARLQRAKRYPGGAGTRREQGVVTLSFSVNRSGRVLGRRIVRSSGYSALDQEALATIERAQPLPPFPAAMTQSVIHLTVPIHFALR